MQGNGDSQLSPAEGLAHTCLLDLKLVWNSPWGVGGAGVGERRNTLLLSTDFLPDWEGSPSLSICPSLSRSKFRLYPSSSYVTSGNTMNLCSLLFTSIKCKALHPRPCCEV